MNASKMDTIAENYKTSISPMCPNSRLRFYVIVLTFGSFISILVSISAVKSIGMSLPSLFIDPYGAFSAVYIPSWNTKELGVLHPDKIISINGAEIGDEVTYNNFPIHRYLQKIEEFAQKGEKEVTLEFSRFEKIISVTPQLRTIGVFEFCTLFLIYVLMGCLLLWSGVIVFAFAYNHPGAQAYAFFTLGAFLFFVTFFDYHTQAWAAPFFSAGTVGLTLGPLWLSFAFPHLPNNNRTVFTAILFLLMFLAIVATILLVIGPLIGYKTLWVRMIIDVAFPVSLLFLGLTVFIRLVVSRGIFRKQLIPTAFGFLCVPVLVGILLTSTVLFGGPVFHIFLPLAPLFIILTIGYSIVRYNILSLGIILDRRSFFPLVIILSLCISCTVFISIHTIFQDKVLFWIFPFFVASVFFIVLVRLGLRGVNHFFFPAAAVFRPTVEYLAEKISILTTVEEIQTEIAQLVKRWLPSTSVNVLQIKEFRGDFKLNDTNRNRLTSGEAFWIGNEITKKHLVQPLRSSGESLGALLLAPKEYNALYTEEDLSLLSTISSLGAIALHNAKMLSEMKQLRKLELQATQKDKQLSIEVLGAEIAHEIVYPLNYFRFLINELRESGKVESQDIDIGHEEVERLERM
ncbi:hypothetical protein KKA14_09565, partial [bacterium]|nr:hypothetical protein [bacterium]